MGELINMIIINFFKKGLFVGSKPNFNKVMMPIIKDLKELELGIIINNEYVRFYLLHGVFDKPARAAIIGCKLMTGKSGCCKCTQEGLTIRTGTGRGKLIDTLKL